MFRPFSHFTLLRNEIMGGGVAIIANPHLAKHPGPWGLILILLGYKYVIFPDPFSDIGLRLLGRPPQLQIIHYTKQTQIIMF